MTTGVPVSEALVIVSPLQNRVEFGSRHLRSLLKRVASPFLVAKVRSCANEKSRETNVFAAQKILF